MRIMTHWSISSLGIPVVVVCLGRILRTVWIVTRLSAHIGGAVTWVLLIIDSLRVDIVSILRRPLLHPTPTIREGSSYGQQCKRN